MNRIVALAALLTLGCGARRVETTEETSVSASAVSPSSGGVVIVEGTTTAYVEGGSTGTPTASDPGAMCRVGLRVFDVDVRAGCVIDERVTASPGVLEYPCGGGRGTVAFGGSVFEGTVDAGGNVLLEIRTAFPFSDGCQWETKQFIRGNLASGGLAYEYREEPNPGQRGCAAACLGTASVRVGPG